MLSNVASSIIIITHKPSSPFQVVSTVSRFKGPNLPTPQRTLSPLSLVLQVPVVSAVLRLKEPSPPTLPLPQRHNLLRRVTRMWLDCCKKPTSSCACCRLREAVESFEIAKEKNCNRSYRNSRDSLRVNSLQFI